MATQKQVLANQLNAQHSMGPASTEGRALVAKNALKHGAFSRQVLLDGESKEEFEVLQNQLYAYFKPQNFLEQLLCERAVAAAWRLGRATKMETILIDQAARMSLLDKGITEVFTESCCFVLQCSLDGSLLLPRESLISISLSNIKTKRLTNRHSSSISNGCFLMSDDLNELK